MDNCIPHGYILFLIQKCNLYFFYLDFAWRSNQSLSEEIAHSHWGAGEPSNMNSEGEDEDCVVIRSDGLKMHDIVCKARRQAICQKRNLVKGEGEVEGQQLMSVAIIGPSVAVAVILIGLLIYFAYRGCEKRKVRRGNAGMG